MRVTAASPLAVSLARNGSAAAVLARIDIWSATGNAWQNAGSAVLQTLALPTESQPLTLAAGNYVVTATISVGQHSTSGHYDYAISLGGQNAVVSSGTIAAASASADGQTYGAEFDLTIA